LFCISDLFYFSRILDRGFSKPGEIPSSIGT
jgi:hypothetical protein